MSYLARVKKCNLITLGEELGIDIPPNTKVTSLVKLIKESEDFDEEFVKCRLEIIQEEKTIAEERAIEAAKEAKWIEIAAEAKRIEIEEKQKEREIEVRWLEIATKTGNLNREDVSEADNIRVKQNHQNIIPRFDGSSDISDISIYLALFEKQMPRLNVPKKNWVMYLLGLLPLKFVNIVSKE